MRRYLAFLSAIFVFLFFSGIAHAASLTLSPSAGTFQTGSTFTASLILDTQGREINALEAVVRFPSDKLQLVSPSSGKSIIEIWTAQPTYDNEKGEIRLQGGIPRGINVSSGLVTTLTFRARTTGEAIVRFGDQSRVLANDGKGTDILGETQGGFYVLILPPPQGPIVSSETHPDQNKWYSNPTAVLSWSNIQQAEEFSYILNDLPVDIPDDISEGSRQSVSYRNVKIGTNYFHIKAFKEGAWGGVTHFAINVDTDPPARFPVEISPAPLTTNKTVLINFQTTDKHSGVSHYEYAVIPLFEAEAAEQNIFVEGKSPVSMTLEQGKYDVVVRVYDYAGNIQESVQRLRIVSFLPLLLLLLLLLLENPLWWVVLLAGTFILISFGWRARKWHHRTALKHNRKELPPEIKKQLEELKEYREKYKKLAAVIVTIAVGFGAFLSGDLGLSEAAEISPPVVTTVSRNIANDEIFYMGGKTDGGNLPVTIYLQNLQTGETLSRQVSSDNKGNWFYRHDTFLSSGRYLLWVQERVGDLVSPPSPQIDLQVQQTALQLGASRISLETIYLLFAVVFFAGNSFLLGYIIVHLRHAKRRHALWLKEVHEAEQSVKRGFAVLKRDIEQELALIRNLKLGKKLSEEERKKEEQLLRDLAWAEQYIGKEIWDVERAEHTD